MRFLYAVLLELLGGGRSVRGWNCGVERQSAASVVELRRVRVRNDGPQCAYTLRRRWSKSVKCPEWYLSFCLLSVGMLFGCASSDSQSPGGTAWYNRPLLRAVWGDFEKSEPLEVADEGQRAALRVRGEYLVQSVAACGVCHGAVAGDPSAPLSGGRLMRDRWGPVRAANITPDKATGIGEWNFLEIMRAVRASIDREGRPLSIDMHADYRWLADRDAKAIALYLRSLPPVENNVERRRLGGFERNRWGLFPRHSDIMGYIPALPEVESANYGSYLARSVAGCRNCHTPGGGASSNEAFSGGNSLPQGTSVVDAVYSLVELFVRKEHDDIQAAAPYVSRGARRELGLESTDTNAMAIARRSDAIEEGRFPIGGPDIRGKSGSILNDWSVEEIVEYLSTGRTRKGETTDGRLCPWPFYRSMQAREKRAIALYLKTL